MGLSKGQRCTVSSRYSTASWKLRLCSSVKVLVSNRGWGGGGGGGLVVSRSFLGWEGGEGELLEGWRMCEGGEGGGAADGRLT